MAVGKKLDNNLITEIAEQCYEQVDPMEDSRGSKWYKKELSRAFARRVLKQALGGNETG